MAFNTKEQEIIKWGLQNGKTKEQVTQALTNFRTGVVTKPETEEVKKPSYLDRLEGSFQERRDEIKDIRSGSSSLPEKILQEAGQVAGGAFDIVTEAPGIKQVLDVAGKGIQKLSETAPIKKAGEIFSPVTQKAIDTYDSLPENIQKDLEAVINISSIIPVGAGVKAGLKVGEKTLSTVSKAAKSATEGLTQTFKAGKKILPKSEEIMNRVARLTPTQANKFEALAGKTHGQYLKETGNFGTPDEIIKKEAQKFTQSIKSVDDSLAQLQGKFKEGIVDDLLEELQQKAIAVSTKNVPAPFSARVKDLIQKNQTDGLTMSEINEAKRLYERNVKLGYNKLTQSEQIQRATNLDNAVREWQVNKAEELGFTNLRELNKQTQLSKQLINSLGDQVVGQTGLNNVNLTDWIVLSGGDATSVAGFLTKKFFSSKKVQSKVAEWLNDIEVKPIVTPKITPSKPRPQPQSKIKSKSASSNTTTKDTKVKSENPSTALATEARKYKSAEVIDYGMSHRPSKTGAIASDISKNGEVIPKDVYTHPEWYANMKDKTYQESFAVLKKIKGKPEAEITIYRSSPKNELNEGDWVTLSKTYANEEGLKEGVKTYSYKVKAKDIQFAGDDINEFGYYPNK